MIDVHDELVAALAHRYDIERELGHGGMAIVYLARDARHGRRVAVKVLRPELATSLGAERFLREINIAARLTHPNILALYDSGEAAGMLYFVMPHVEGETLRERMAREHQLPVDEALAITRQVGLALDYAHEHGVVHRDIKPENILLVGDHVLVADFGLARALYSAGTERLTESAVAVGTPAYMSPEQAAADPDVDGRTDLYSLACVLFEMIAGLPPFKGATAAALLAQHLTAKPPSICAQRPHCPKAVDAAVERALEKTPADRYRTAKEFVAALTAPTSGTSGENPATGPTDHRRRFARMLDVSGVAVAAAIVAAILNGPPPPPETAVATDRNSFVVLPLSASDPAARRDTAMVAQRIADALGEWNGVQVAGGRQTSELLAALGRSDRVRLDDAFDVARRLGVAKLVWGDLSAAGDERRARLTIYEVSTRTEFKSTTLTYGLGGPSTAKLRLTANTLVRTREELPWSGSAPADPPSLPAWQAYDAGRDAVGRWDVAEATRKFSAAVAIDPSHAQANLWWSLVQMWSGAAPDRWRSAAKRAYELRGHLRSGDTALATAQLALAEGRYPEACAAYRRVLATDSSGVIGWYGLGECQSRDSLVVRDRASPSAWRFRGSLHQAIRAYMRIVDGGVPPQPPFVYSRLSKLLVTSGNVLRPGHSEHPVRVEFGAYQTLDADTLATIPYPLADSAGRGGAPIPATKARAVYHNRTLLRRLARTWAAGTPTVAAHAALATLLESLDEIGAGGGSQLSALAQIRRARALSADSAERLLLARTELRLLVKTGDWTHVASFTDSLFAANPDLSADTAGALAGAAALSGRIGKLAAMLRGRGGAPTFTPTMPNGQPLDVPPALKDDAAGTFAYALSGACVDTLRDYRRRVDQQLPRYIPDPRQRAIARGALLRRPLAVAMPCVGAASLLGIQPAGDKMVQMEQAFASHDVPAFRAVYEGLMSYRSVDRPGENALDYTYIESWILRALGDSAEAAEHLDQSLEALPTLGPFILDFPAHSAALVRAMGLRAELAAAAGDKATAARWGNAVATLWAHADPELQPYVRQMCSLTERCVGAPGHGVER